MLALALGAGGAACAFNPDGTGTLGGAGGAAGTPVLTGRGGTGGRRADGAAGSASTGSGGTRDGGASGRGGATGTGGGPGADALPADARITIDSSAPCLEGLAATPCAPEGLRCTQDDPYACKRVQCSCVAAYWACAVDDIAGCKPEVDAGR